MRFRKAQTKRTIVAGGACTSLSALPGIVCLVLLFLSSASLKSQGLRLNIYSAHVSDVALTCNYLTSGVDPKTICGGSQYGGGLEMVFKRMGSLELLYLRQTRFHPEEERPFEANSPLFPASVNYVLVSAGGHLQNPLGEIQGYGALVGGISITSQQQTGDAVTSKKAAWGGRLGCTWWVAKKVGLKVESLFLFSQSPVYDPPAPSISRFYIQTSIHQVTMTGGVMFKICGE